MTLKELLHEKGDAIVQRWLKDALAAYPESAALAFSRQKDPFANPVGHSLRLGTQEIFDALLEGSEDSRIHAALLEIIRIRAVQEISPARAVGFAFGLKSAIRAELGEVARDEPLASELAEIEGQIDRIALAAFDIYVECREQVYELRIDEVKRRVSWVVEKMNETDADPKPAPVDSNEGVCSRNSELISERKNPAERPCRVKREQERLWNTHLHRRGVQAMTVGRDDLIGVDGYAMEVWASIVQRCRWDDERHRFGQRYRRSKAKEGPVAV